MPDVDLSLEQLERRLEQGDPAAKDDLVRVVQQRCQQRGQHTQWGLLCEKAELFGLAFREFQLAVRDDPSDPVACFKLAEYFREHGDGRRAAALLERLLETNPAHEQWLTAYCELLQEEGAFPKLEQTLQRALANGLPRETADRLRGRRTQDDEQPAPASPGPELAPTDADCVRMAALFAGREDVHARQWADPRQGRTGYTPVHEPLTPAVVRNHLLGTYTVGVYPIRLDGTATWFALDLDMTRKALDHARRDRSVAQALRQSLRELGPWLLSVLRTFGFAPLFENSGYKGRHYWVFLQQPEDTAVLHQLGRLLVAHLQPHLPSEFHLEFFPKQASRSGKGLGNLIKLPLGIHRRTGYRSLLLDDSGNPLPDPLDALRHVQKTDRNTLYQAIQRLKDVAARAGRAQPPQPDQAEPPEADTAVEPVAAPPPPDVPLPWTEADFETDRHVRHLLQNCPVLAELKRQVDEHRRLSHDEQVVLIHTLGHLTGGPQAVNYLFGKCVDVPPERYLKSQLRGNPMSCPKIRKRIGHVTRRVDCNCLFEFAPDRYPTPLLHLLTLPPEEPTPAQPPPSPVPDDLETLARRFGVLERRRREVLKEWQVLHDALCQALRQLPDRQLRVADGTYRLLEKDGVEELVWEQDDQTTNQKQPDQNGA